MAIIGFDTSILLNYYGAKLQNSLLSSLATASPNSTSSSGSSSASNSSTSSTQSGTNADVPPWDPSAPQLPDEQKNAAAMNSSPFIDLSAATLSTAARDGANGQDNERLFALYKAADRLSSLAQIAASTNSVAGQRDALNARYQAGLAEITDFLQTQSFDNLTVLPGYQTGTTTSSAVIPLTQTTITGRAIVKGDPHQAIPGLDVSKSLTVTVTKGGVTTNVPIDLSNVQGTLDLDNIVSYINSQLQADGFSSRFHRTQIGAPDSNDVRFYGLNISPLGGEKLSLSSGDAKPALYVAGNTGTGSDASGRLVKLTNLDGTVTSAFSVNVAPDTDTVSVDTKTSSTDSTSDTSTSTTTKTVSGGALTVHSSAVDSQGNVYVVGDTSGNMQGEINQGTRDAVLAKYNSAGQILWSKLLGSSETAAGMAVAVDDKDNVVIAGSVTGKLSDTTVGGGTDSFVSKYNAQGDELFTKQVSPVADDSVSSIAIGDDGSIYLAGQVKGAIAAGQTNQGGADIFVRKIDATGKLVYNRQFGSSGADIPSQIALTDDGGLVVTSMESGQAVVRKFDASDGTSSAIWEKTLGDLTGGTLSGLAVKDGDVYLSGSTGNGSLTASGEATVQHAFSGSSDAFLFKLTDNGTSANADYISYVGTDKAEKGGGVAVTDDGIYLTGTTYGQFAGASAPTSGASNTMVSRFEEDGTLSWTQQYGGLSGTSSGVSVAVDNSGAGVLDALGLPKGNIVTDRPSDLLSQSTVRAGDYFTVKVTQANDVSRQQRITIQSGETMRSLAVKVNSVLMLDGKASASFIGGGQALRITSTKDRNEQIELIPGSGDLDALSGLGISTRLLINKVTPATTTSSGKVQDNAQLAKNATPAKVTDNANPNSATTNSTGPLNFTDKRVISLGLTGKTDLSSVSDAQDAATKMQALVSQIKTTYRKLNDPAFAASLDSLSASPSSPQFSSSGNGSVPAYMQTQLAGYAAALQRLAGSSSTTISLF